MDCNRWFNGSFAAIHTMMKETLFTKLIGSKTGYSHKRFIAVLFSVVLVLFGCLLFAVAIPENNVPLFNQVLYIFSGVILFQSGASVFEKGGKVDKKENSESEN